MCENNNLQRQENTRFDWREKLDKIEQLYPNKNETKFEVYRTFHTILKNIIMFPTVEKYRRINCENKRLQKVLSQVKGEEDMLKCIGFRIEPLANIWYLPDGCKELCVENLSILEEYMIKANMDFERKDNTLERTRAQSSQRVFQTQKGKNERLKQQQEYREHLLQRIAQDRRELEAEEQLNKQLHGNRLYRPNRNRFSEPASNSSVRATSACPSSNRRIATLHDTKSNEADSASTFNPTDKLKKHQEILEALKAPRPFQGAGVRLSDPNKKTIIAPGLPIDTTELKAGVFVNVEGEPRKAFGNVNVLQNVQNDINIKSFETTHFDNMPTNKKQTNFVMANENNGVTSYSNNQTITESEQQNNNAPLIRKSPRDDEEQSVNSKQETDGTLEDIEEKIPAMNEKKTRQILIKSPGASLCALRKPNQVYNTPQIKPVYTEQKKNDQIESSEKKCVGLPKGSLCMAKTVPSAMNISAPLYCHATTIENGKQVPHTVVAPYWVSNMRICQLSTQHKVPERVSSGEKINNGNRTLEYVRNKAGSLQSYHHRNQTTPTSTENYKKASRSGSSDTSGSTSSRASSSSIQFEDKNVRVLSGSLRQISAKITVE